MPRPVRPPPKLKAQASQVVRTLTELYPTPHCALVHSNAFELLVATILSAQCTDVRVNQVTPALFSRYPDAPALASADLGDVESLIHSTGFFRAKAKNLIAMASSLVAAHGGEVPSEIRRVDESFRSRSQDGRTWSSALRFGLPSGVVVDTHVKRLSFRLGLTRSEEPVVIEHELARLLPRDEWINFSHRLIEHGRKVCIARRPRCEDCRLSGICPKNGVAPGDAR